MKQNKYKITKYDYVISGFSVIAVFLVPLILLHKNNNSIGNEALIYQNGKIIREISLHKNEVISIDKMQIEAKNGEIRIKSSNCPKEMCKHMGRISSAGQAVVCVPNKIAIEIKGKTENQEYNVMSY